MSVECGFVEGSSFVGLKYAIFYIKTYFSICSMIDSSESSVLSMDILESHDGFMF